jgi:hypothetical protein
MDDEKPYNPHRPDWDKSKDGELPEELSDEFANSAKIAKAQEKEWDELQALTPEQRLDRLDAIQIEASNLANSQGASLMTPEQQFIVQWQRGATVAASQLLVFQNPNNKVEDREAKVEECKRTLATALYKLGNIPDALAIASPFPELVSHIQSIQAAKEKPDAELHSHFCSRPEALQDDKVIELDRHWNTEEVFSELHGKKVNVWECTVCGCKNASPEVPERQARYDASMMAAIHKLAKGDQPNAKGIVEGPKLRQFEAATILAKES